jgi:hypothetical protein
MRRLLLPTVALPLLLGTCGALGKPAVSKSSSARVAPSVNPTSAAVILPLALDDAYEIEKVFTVLIDPEVTGKIDTPWLRIERDRRYFGAINEFERRLRDGHTYTVRWKANAKSSSDITVRFEYRQQKLGSHVQAQEVRYPAASGSMRTEFAVQGDDYHQDGQVTAWRMLLIEQGRVVGLQQSFLW